MAFTSAISSNEGRPFSIGPVKMEIQTFSCLSTDTSGTVTAKTLSVISECLILAGGPDVTAITINAGTPPTVSLTMADPAAACTGYVASSCVGRILLLGK